MTFRMSTSIMLQDAKSTGIVGGGEADTLLWEHQYNIMGQTLHLISLASSPSSVW